MGTQTSTTLEHDDLQQLLEEREQLILVLTERLEEAAEQLDRVQRTGADRNGRNGGAGSLPAEVVQQHRQLLTDLSETVGRWDAVQPADAFGRIESRLAELRELIERGFEGGVHSGPAVSVPAAAPSEKPKPAATPKKEPFEGWEALKAQLLGEPLATPPATPPVELAAEDTPPAPAAETAALGETLAFNLTEAELPSPIDFDVAEREELEHAIEVRDRYIDFLTGRLTIAEQRDWQPIDWDALNQAPEELRAKLQQLEGELQEKLRISEVDLSLERARLSRLQSRLEAMQRQIERRLKSKSGKTSEPPADDSERHAKSWFGSLVRKS
jgi:hypothetical protein